MAEAWQRVVAFDPAAEPVPPPLDDLVRRAAGEASALLIVAGGQAHADGWAAAAAARIARELARAGRRVVLADAAFEDPRLTSFLAPDADGEGLIEALLYGASLDHVGRVLPDEPFELAPAGTAYPDVGVLLFSPAWSTLLDTAAAEGATVAVYAPASAPGVSGLAGRIGSVVVLATAAEAERIVSLLPPDAGVEAVLSPAPAPTPAPAPGAPPRAGVPEATEARAEGAAAAPERGGGGLPFRIALAVALVLAAAWFGWDRWGRDDARQSAPVDDAAPAADSAAEAAAAAEGTPLPYSVAVESYPDTAEALRRADVLRGREPDVKFFVAPILLDSVVYYRVMAGPLADSASAAALMRQLVARGVKNGPDDWSVRPTPWAFQVGEDAPMEEALARVASLRERGVPAYVVTTGLADGETYRVYAGAFEGPALADLMGKMLQQAGVDARLVRRTGRAPE